MPLNVPNVGEAAILEMIVNKTAPQNLFLDLFTNNITPADTDTAVTYTAATFPGYVQKTLTGANWTSGNPIVYNAQQSFDCTGATSQNIYGYFIRQSVSNILLWSERDAAAPVLVTVSGDSVRVTPQLGAD